MTRPRIAYALAWASFKDGVALVSTAVRFLAVEPTLCRVRGHRVRALYDGEQTIVAVLCVRCGTTVEA